MKIIAKCAKCDKELETGTAATTVLNDVKIEIFPCKNAHCPKDCSECEDLDIQKARAVRAEKALEDANFKLQNVKDVLE